MTMQPAPTGLFSKVYGFASARVAMAVLLVACSAITGRGEQTSGGGSVDPSGTGGASITGGTGEGGLDDVDAASSGGGTAGTDIDMGDGSTIGPGGGQDAGEKMCLGDQGVPTVCDVTSADAGCTSVGAYCQRLSTLLKAGVAAQAISCINLVAGCSPQSVARCVRIALFSACADPGADASCARISELCANSIPTSVEECHGFLNGMTEAGRQAVLSCVAPDGGATCTQDLPGCVRAL